jgi:hypothetical protein
MFFLYYYYLFLLYKGPKQPRESRFGRMKALLKSYGKVGVLVYVLIYGISLSTLYFLLKRGVNVPNLLSSLGVDITSKVIRINQLSFQSILCLSSLMVWIEFELFFFRFSLAPLCSFSKRVPLSLSHSQLTKCFFLSDLVWLYLSLPLLWKDGDNGGQTESPQIHPLFHLNPNKVYFHFYCQYWFNFKLLNQ